MPGLDRYDPNLLDEDDYDAMSPGTRAAVEQELRRRDRELGGRRGLEYGNLKFSLKYEKHCSRYIEKNIYFGCFWIFFFIK